MPPQSGYTGVLLRVAVMAAALVAGGAARASDRCADLHARLASLDARPANAFAAAAQRQRQELERTRRHAAACGWASSAPCIALAATVREMEGNLARLDAAARRQPGGDRGAERTRLMQALAANRCEAAAPRTATTAPPIGGLLSAFFPFLDTRPQAAFGAADRSPVPPIPTVDEMRRQREQAVDTTSPQGFAGGTYRTLCVRACDGYFWPVSFSVRPGAFRRDEEVCRAACPNLDVALYVHRNPGAWSEAAVSLDGRPYAELATANLFRREFNPACQCQPAQSAAMNAQLSDREARSDGAPAHFAAQRLRGGIDAASEGPETE